MLCGVFWVMRRGTRAPPSPLGAGAAFISTRASLKAGFKSKTTSSVRWGGAGGQAGASWVVMEGSRGEGAKGVLEGSTAIGGRGLAQLRRDVLQKS